MSNDTGETPTDDTLRQVYATEAAEILAKARRASSFSGAGLPAPTAQDIIALAEYLRVGTGGRPPEPDLRWSGETIRITEGDLRMGDIIVRSETKRERMVKWVRISGAPGIVEITLQEVDAAGVDIHAPGTWVINLNRKTEVDVMLPRPSRS